MRTYLSTKREREALYDWIGGRVHRDQDTSPPPSSTERPKTSNSSPTT